MDQRCTTCAHCTPIAEHPDWGECSTIGAIVLHAETGGRCKVYQAANDGTDVPKPTTAEGVVTS